MVDARDVFAADTNNDDVMDDMAVVTGMKTEEPLGRD